LKTGTFRHWSLKGGLLLILWAMSISGLAAQSSAITDTETGVSYTVEKYVTANYPVALAFAPDGRLFYTEKTTGNVRVVSADGQLESQPVIHLDTDALQERGLLGITLDPDYAENGLIWVMHTASGTSADFPANNVVRFHEQGGVGTDPEIMLSVPITSNQLLHNGGNLYFDNDGLLYITLGDYGDAANSQDLSTMPGKIHRFEVTADGLIPAAGNPFTDSSIYAYGLRNSFDFTIDPLSRQIFATENGLHCDDEINVILPGFNYGARADYECVSTGMVDLPLYMPPLYSWTPTIAPTGITVYDHPAVPEWNGQLLFCSWVEGALYRAVLDQSRNEIASVHTIDLGDAECRIDIVVGPDGSLYFSTVDESGAIYRLRFDAGH
jgi:aldose sugar dehydrogenase